MRNRIKGAVVAAAVTLAGAVLPLLPASAQAAACTPSVSLDQPYTDPEGVTHFVSRYDTCGQDMLLKHKSRVYRQGRYETSATVGVNGSGVAEFQEGGCGGEPPPKAQWLSTLKVGPVLYAKSAPRTYTIPYRPCT